jgi:hypothetical protein
LSIEGSATVSVHFCCKGHIDSYATMNGVGDQTANPAAPRRVSPRVPDWFGIHA